MVIPMSLQSKDLLPSPYIYLHMSVYSLGGKALEMSQLTVAASVPIIFSLAEIIATTRFSDYSILNGLPL